MGCISRGMFAFIYLQLLSVSSLRTVHLMVMQTTRDSKYAHSHVRYVDVRFFKGGNLIEYLSSKGRKQTALVIGRSGSQIEVLNDAKNKFRVQPQRVSFRIDGNYNMDDLLSLNGAIASLKPVQVEKLWESVSDKKSAACDLTYVSSMVFGSIDTIKQFSCLRLMDTYGTVFFQKIDDVSNIADANPPSRLDTFRYVALPSKVVQNNIRDRAALKEFKQRFTKITSTAQAGKKDSTSSSTTAMMTPDIPARVMEVLDRYQEGLIQLIVKGHPWTSAGLARRQLDAENQAKGKEILEYLDLPPTYKNAKRVLEIAGFWSTHTNVEKFVMDLRDSFPPQVMDETQYLLDNADSLHDPDERLRRNLRHLRSYAIDSEGAAEVDDAISIEVLEDGREKLWVHIADVSRWIRPGSHLSLEAERRMTTVYMPDERISMFPEVLSQELLSLGSSLDSYALSCGVTLKPSGEIESYEVCPSKIRITRRLSYVQLDEYLNRGAAVAASSGDDEDGSRSTSSGSKVASSSESGSGGDIVGSGSSSSGGSGSMVTDPIISEKATSKQQRSRNEFPYDSLFGVESRTGNKQISSSAAYPTQLTDGLRQQDSSLVADLMRLNHWAQLRLSWRNKVGALDLYMRHKIELTLNVKRDNKAATSSQPPKLVVSGSTAWANTTSVSLVTEYMILMSEAIGSMCVAIQAPVWYKTQQAEPPVAHAERELLEGENEFMRSVRLLRRLKKAKDSSTPGLHVTSGCTTYVQCTSPIRRYHDLYNHYRLKAAMHGASLGEKWAGRAAEEAGISRLDDMASGEERLHTLIASNLVSKHRGQYWMELYIEKLLASSPPLIMEVLVCESRDIDLLKEYASSIPIPPRQQSEEVEGEEEDVESLHGNRLDGMASKSDSETSDRLRSDIRALTSSPGIDTCVEDSGGRVGSLENATIAVGSHSCNPEAPGGYVYDSIVLMLGSNTRYRLYSPNQLRNGQLVKCYMYRRFTNPLSYLLLPTEFSLDAIPTGIANQLRYSGTSLNRLSERDLDGG